MTETADPRASALPGAVPVNLHVNGGEHPVLVDPRTTLLDALREGLHLTGTKKGCDHGQCGACTVHVDGERVLSCLTLAAFVGDAEVTTVEGLATPDGDLHPVQRAFVTCDGLQCGYCTPGQIMSTVALTEREGCPPDRDGIREAMSGNLCRCGAYDGIAEAVERVRDGGVER